jgi:hypothetical protein
MTQASVQHLGDPGCWARKTRPAKLDAFMCYLERFHVTLPDNDARADSVRHLRCVLAIICLLLSSASACTHTCAPLHVLHHMWFTTCASPYHPPGCTLTSTPFLSSTARMFCVSSVTVLAPATELLAQANPERSWKPSCLQQQQQQQFCQLLCQEC